MLKLLLGSRIPRIYLHSILAGNLLLSQTPQHKMTPTSRILHGFNLSSIKRISPKSSAHRTAMTSIVFRSRLLHLSATALHSSELEEYHSSSRVVTMAWEALVPAKPMTAKIQAHFFRLSQQAAPSSPPWEQPRMSTPRSWLPTQTVSSAVVVSATTLLALPTRIKWCQHISPASRGNSVIFSTPLDADILISPHKDFTTLLSGMEPSLSP